jgi:iron(III) transport system substrate-binding protein
MPRIGVPDPGLLLAVSILLAGANPGLSATLSKTTLEATKKLNINPAIFVDAEKELQVPEKWVTEAKRERQLKIMSTEAPDQMRILFSAFEERYPYISIQYSRTTSPERVKVLVSYRAGRISTDILTPIGLDDMLAWEGVGGLDDLRDLPNSRLVGDLAHGPGGIVVGVYTLYRCMGYNTRLVQKSDLPKRWEDLLTNPRWRDGKLALGNRTIWIAPLWKAKGEEWAKNYLQKLFTEIKPQRRKEGLNSLAELLAAGEFDALLPTNNGAMHMLAERGAPVSFICPDPAPMGVGYAGILKGASHPYAARLFLNWLLSKEGQVLQYAARNFAPVRMDLRLPELIPFSEGILGRDIAFDDFKFARAAADKIDEVWNSRWIVK